MLEPPVLRRDEPEHHLVVGQYVRKRLEAARAVGVVLEQQTSKCHAREDLPGDRLVAASAEHRPRGRCPGRCASPSDPGRPRNGGRTRRRRPARAPCAPAPRPPPVHGVIVPLREVRRVDLDVVAAQRPLRLGNQVRCGGSRRPWGDQVIGRRVRRAREWSSCQKMRWKLGAGTVNLVRARAFAFRNARTHPWLVCRMRSRPRVHALTVPVSTVSPSPGALSPCNEAGSGVSRHSQQTP